MANLHQEIAAKLRLEGNLSTRNSRIARKEAGHSRMERETGTSILNASSSSNRSGKSPSRLQLPGGSKKVRSRENSKSPGRYGNGGDRFIPKLNQQFQGLKTFSEDDKKENEGGSYGNDVMQALGKDANQGILSYGQRPRTALGGIGHANKIIYSASKSKTKVKSSRTIPTEADRILDAPDIVDDFYLNLIDWGPSNMVAVALGRQIYLWNAITADISELYEMPEEHEYICSVKWIDGQYLSVGDSRNRVQIWDVEKGCSLRSMRSHAARVSSLSSFEAVLSSGSKSGFIHHHDVRIAQHHIGTLENHCQEVSGLSWSPNGKYLASGGNDNVVNIWSNDTGEGPNEAITTPIQEFSEHQAGVKALSWCPWKHQLLASGGGTSCRHVKIWNVANGTKITEINTENQVSGIVWHQSHRELMTSHGYPNNQLKFWKYPKFSHITDLDGHEARILGMSMSPCTQMVCTLGADETLRIWDCFTIEQKEKPKVAKSLNPSKITTSLR